MAFDNDYLVEVLSVPSFAPGPSIFLYRSPIDNFATVTAAGYFNPINSFIDKYDYMFIQATDGGSIFEFSSVQGVTPVTVVNIIDVPDINLPEGNLLIGDAAGVSSALDMSTDGNILVGDGTTANSVAVSGDLTIDNAGVTTIGQAINGANIVDVTDNNVIGTVPVVHKVVVTGGATTNYDVTLTHKTTVTGVTFQFNGAGDTSDTVQVLNSASAITEAFDANQADNASLPAAEINDANATIAAAGTLRVTYTDNAGSDGPSMFVYVHGVREA